MTTCARPGCLVEFTPRTHQTFCSAACRSAAHQAKVDSGLAARVKSVRYLSSGKVSLVLHCDTADLRPGEDVSILKGEAA